MPIQERARIRAPEFKGDKGWLNTDKPLSLAGLKGKVVLLDFWTYGCINCLHIIPDLKKLEKKYPNELVVIGVHSAKFENEKDTENIRRIILRYEIEHPIVNDADFAIWRSYAVDAWPTRYLIDPAGYIIGKLSGEGGYEVLDKAIADSLAEFRKRGELNEAPLKLVLERAKVGDLPLAFPGKVLADQKTGRLFIADSNHNRVVLAKLDGTMIETIGAGSAGADDGPFDRATFFRPQGMALDGDTLYVADTENHLIREVDLKSKTVKTIAGTGQQSREAGSIGMARATALNSPWDLQLVGGRFTSRWPGRIRFGSSTSLCERFLNLPVRDARLGLMASGRKQRFHSRRRWRLIKRLCMYPTPKQTLFARSISVRTVRCAPWLVATCSILVIRTGSGMTCACSIRWDWRVGMTSC